MKLDSELAFFILCSMMYCICVAAGDEEVPSIIKGASYFIVEGQEKEVRIPNTVRAPYSQIAFYSADGKVVEKVCLTIDQWPNLYSIAAQKLDSSAEKPKIKDYCFVQTVNDGVEKDHTTYIVLRDQYERNVVSFPYDTEKRKVKGYIAGRYIPCYAPLVEYSSRFNLDHIKRAENMDQQAKEMHFYFAYGTRRRPNFSPVIAWYDPLLTVKDASYYIFEGAEHKVSPLPKNPLSQGRVFCVYSAEGDFLKRISFNDTLSASSYSYIKRYLDEYVKKPQITDYCVVKAKDPYSVNHEFREFLVARNKCGQHVLSFYYDTETKKCQIPRHEGYASEFEGIKPEVNELQKDISEIVMVDFSEAHEISLDRLPKAIAAMRSFDNSMVEAVLPPNSDSSCVIQ